MSLATRLAVAFALVAGVVAALVGVLSYHAAADRISQEVDQTLQTVTTSLASGQTAVLSPPVAIGAGDSGGGGDGGPRGEGQPVVAQTCGCPKRRNLPLTWSFVWAASTA